jgi:hypothetical protein
MDERDPRSPPAGPRSLTGHAHSPATQVGDCLVKV